eukprot:TRINITY_DN109149_c0_g1_i1.p1 TRINITY_DN109149_c0_g1~~TRINITY_DN109149_c0_g1_i1.p1  ORF type:complete len:533 (+),score=77.11 TRINITY_DN109149_c0_g1_i1:156-1754(+)
MLPTLRKEYPFPSGNTFPSGQVRFRKQRRAVLMAAAATGAVSLSIVPKGDSPFGQLRQLSMVPGRIPLNLAGAAALAGATGVAALNAPRGQEGTAAAADPPGKMSSSSSSTASSTLTASVLNLSKNIIGAGMLSLPFAMKGAGVLPFLAGLLALGAINGYTFFLLGWCCKAVGARSFGELWSKTFGTESSWIADLSVVMNNSLACLAYCVLIGDFMSKSLAGLIPDVPLLHDRGVDLVLVAFALLIPLSLLKDLASLRYASIAGLGVTFYAFLLLVSDCWKESSGLLSPTGPVMVNFCPYRVDFFQAIALFSSAFAAHYNAPKFCADLKDNSLQRWSMLVALAFGLALLVFAIFGFCGFVLFGFSVEGNVLKNYGAGPEALFAWLGMAFSVAFTFPLVFSTFSDSFAGLVSRSSSFQVDTSGSGFRVPFTISAVALLVCGGTIFSNLAVVNGVKGAILSACLAFIYPALIHLRLSDPSAASAPSFDGSTSQLMRAGSYVLIVFGVLSGIMALLAMFVLPKTDFSALAAQMSK